MVDCVDAIDLIQKSCKSELSLRFCGRLKIFNLAASTDDTSLFRQWDGKRSNAVAHLNKGYAWVLFAMRDAEDELALCVGAAEHDVDVEHFASDLNFILIDRAKQG